MQLQVKLKKLVATYVSNCEGFWNGQEQNMLKKIKQLGFGSVEMIRIPSFGVYICVDLQPLLVSVWV